MTSDPDAAFTLYSGPEMSQLTESLEAAFGGPMPGDDVHGPQPVRPSDMPELFNPPTQSNYDEDDEADNNPWERPLPPPAPWQRPARGPNHEQNQRLIARLGDVKNLS